MPTRRFLSCALLLFLWAFPARADDARQVAEAHAAHARGDYARAWSLALRPGVEGNAQAQLLIGRMLYDGQGTAQDRCLATPWFDKAARKGLPEAQYRMGWAYAWGYGVYQSDHYAYRWLTLAENGGHAAAKPILAQVSGRMEPDERVSLPEVQQEYRYKAAVEGRGYLPLPAALLDDPTSFIREWFSPCHGPEVTTPPPRRDRHLEGLPSLKDGMAAFERGDYLEAVDHLTPGSIYAREEATDIVTMLLMTGRAGWGDRCVGAVWAQGAKGDEKVVRPTAYFAKALLHGWGFRRDPEKAYLWALWTHRHEPSAIDFRLYENLVPPERKPAIAERVENLFRDRWPEESFLVPEDIRAANPDSLPGLAPCRDQ